MRPVTLELKKQSSLSCPVKLMKAFLKLRDKNQGVLFIFRDATTAAAKGYSDAQIQTMGRWKSGAFKKYIRIPTISIT